jgi:hypothetical protein
MNLRVIMTGAFLVGLALAFFFGMATIAPKSNDPVAMMQTVGTVSDGAGVLGLVMVVFGVARKKR